VNKLNFLQRQDKAGPGQPDRPGGGGRRAAGCALWPAV